MSNPVAGKVVALTGAFSKLKRADAEAQLAKLGATIAQSLSRKTQLLIYGDKAGSKLALAQSYGVEARDEAWLMSVLAGGDGSDAKRVEFTGPLSDYLARVEAWANELRKNPHIKVGFLRAPGVSPERLDRLAEAWGLASFSPAIRNLYLQSDGFCVYWVDTNHLEFGDRWDMGKHFGQLWHFEQLSRDTIPSMARMPTVPETEAFPWHLGGIFWVVPAAGAFKRAEGFQNFAYGVIGNAESRHAYGREWKGEALEGAIRVFEVAMQFYPVGFLMDPPREDPPVIIGDDHGACWTDSRVANFEDYLEGMLATHFTERARRAMVVGHNPREVRAFVRPEPVSIESLLAAPPKAKAEGGNFALRVEAVTPCTETEARALRLRARFSAYFDRIKPMLGLRTSELHVEAFSLEFAEATKDLKAIPAGAVGPLCAVTGAKAKTKKALGPALFVGFDTPSELVRVTVSTRFDLKDFQQGGTHGRLHLEAMVSGCTLAVVQEQLGARGEVIAWYSAGPSGTDVLVAGYDVLMAPGHRLASGDELRSAIEPTKGR